MIECNQVSNIIHVFVDIKLTLSCNKLFQKYMLCLEKLILKLCVLMIDIRIVVSLSGSLCHALK